jgi:hypothetical protein
MSVFAEEYESKRDKGRVRGEEKAEMENSRHGTRQFS